MTATGTGSTYFVRVKPVDGVKKITARLNSPMPAFTTLALAMAPPAGATSFGAVILTGVDQDIVVNMQMINPGTTQSMTYTFTATAAAGVVPSQTRIVTLTMLAYP